MFQTICDLIPHDVDYSPRTRTLDILRRALDGTLYDVLPHQFHEERGSSGEYIPLRSRRPSVRYALCRIVVEDSVALLFSEGHFPRFDSPNRHVRAKEARLNQLMIDAAIRGSVGSIAILMRVLRGRVFFDILDTTYLTPQWDREEPDTLANVSEKYKVRSSILAAAGYELRTWRRIVGLCGDGTGSVRFGSDLGQSVQTDRETSIPTAAYDTVLDSYR